MVEDVARDLRKVCATSVVARLDDATKEMVRAAMRIHTLSQHPQSLRLALDLHLLAHQQVHSHPLMHMHVLVTLAPLLRHLPCCIADGGGAGRVQGPSKGLPRGGTPHPTGLVRCVARVLVSQ